MTMLTTVAPLSLYIHMPWCVHKCPYCDFNSHALRNEMPADQYIDALVRDLEAELPLVWGRGIETIFIGGGTPSLFSPGAIDRLLSDIRARIPLKPSAEITLEANPGVSDAKRFAGYLEAGVNRLSIGIQSLNDEMLRRLGRIHNATEALQAYEAARTAGFENINLDLMFGLPAQTIRMARDDLARAIALDPEHLSVYQLTIEANTAFAAQPPSLPDDDTLADMHEALKADLAAADYQQYEVSAFSRAGRRCQHNMNYWQFGDYLGIGAGAHGKRSDHAGIHRRAKTRHPKAYLALLQGSKDYYSEHRLAPEILPAEFMLNALRLTEGFDSRSFSERTGLPLSSISEQLLRASARGLITQGPAHICPTLRGQLFLNDLVSIFLDDSDGASIPHA